MDDSRSACLPFGREDLDATPGVPPLRLLHQPAGASVEVKRSGFVFGRHSDADVRLPLPDVSRRHCRFVYAEGRWEVIDLDSLNGVFVNGERVRRWALRHRDRVGLGGFVFEVDLRVGDRTGPFGAAEADDSGAVLRRIADALDEPEELRRAS